MASLNSETRKIPTRLHIHGRNFKIKEGVSYELEKLGFSFDGEEISSTIWFKSHFDKAVRILDGAFFDWEVRGNFSCGMFIKTVGIND